MNRKTLAKIERELREILMSPHNRTHSVLAGYAKKLGRTRENRGKEPTFERAGDPVLFPCLTIPGHSGDLAPGTVRSVVNQLLNDVDAWKFYLMENEQ